MHYRSHHSDNLWIYGFRQDALVVGDVVQYLVKSSSLDLFCSDVAHWVRKVKDVAALLELTHKEASSLFRGGVCECGVCVRREGVCVRREGVCEKEGRVCVWRGGRGCVRGGRGVRGEEGGVCERREGVMVEGITTCVSVVVHGASVWMRE